MSFEPPKKESKNNKPNKAARRRKKRINQASLNQTEGESEQEQNQQSQSVFEQSWASWTQNFTAGLNWQLKHQLALLKAKEKALEYENKVLTDTIRNLYIGSQMREQSNEQSSDSESTEPERVSETADTGMGTISDIDSDSEATEDISLDEGYIQHALETYGFRQERARLAKADAEKRAPPIPDPEPYFEHLKQLYGSGWQRIAALETAMQANFMKECDIENPAYWPAVPLNKEAN